MEVSDFVPVLIQVCLALLIGAAIIIASGVVGQKGRKNRIKDTAYECGVPPAGTSKTRFAVKFYVTAMLFILFDIEVVFLYPIGVILKDADSVFVLGELVVFVVLLLVAFVYVWRKGALDWR